jgi:hypothetical protein
MLPAAEAAGSIALQWVDRNHCAVPVNGVDDWVPATSETETVAVFAPVVCVVSGLNWTVTTQVAPGARVVSPRSCPPPAGPHDDRSRMMVNSVALVPLSVPWPMPVNGTLPVLVSVNT